MTTPTTEPITATEVDYAAMSDFELALMALSHGIASQRAGRLQVRLPFELVKALAMRLAAYGASDDDAD